MGLDGGTGGGTKPDPLDFLWELSACSNPVGVIQVGICQPIQILQDPALCWVLSFLEQVCSAKLFPTIVATRVRKLAEQSDASGAAVAVEDDS